MIVIVMGVVGAGKTTVGKCWLSANLGGSLPTQTIFIPVRMSRRFATASRSTDADREPWLDHLREAIARWIAAGAERGAGVFRA